MEGSYMNITDYKQSAARFGQYLLEQERSVNTIGKYLRDTRAFVKFLGKKDLNKAVLVEYKSRLAEKYAPASVNSMLAAVNCFLEFIGMPNLRVKPLKIQKALFSEREKELTKEEYERLVMAAKHSGNERLSLIIETICSTGIRVSEVKFITVEAVREGRAEISCKGKHRVVFLPDDLRKLLAEYIEKRGIEHGSVFITRNGKPLDRSNIWRDMKNLCENAKVSRQKVFPHNLRHLFARTFYSIEKDLSRLADILGHSSVNTTRIYTMESGEEHARLLNKLNLIVYTT